ncbi:MAG: hypothetical protein NVSMB25_01730 [Thermoleophilaceae bacterium]
MNRNSNIFAGLLGGLMAVILGAVLLATGAIHSSGTRTVVEQVPVSAAAHPASQRSAGLTVSDIYKRVSPGVAFVKSQIVQRVASPFGLPNQQQGQATGSGFVYDKRGFIVTNAHVVDGAKNVQVSFDNGAFVDAKIVGRDVSSDIAVLKVDPGKVKLVPLPLGDSSKLQVGDPTVAIGNPFGYSDTVTTGIVSALQRHIDSPNMFSIGNVIQTDAAINPGNSGGPLLDGEGRVIGINSQIATDGSKGSVGIGFAIPVNLTKSIVPTLIGKGTVRHAYIGITTTAVTSQVAHDLNLATDKGALVEDVVAGGPAAKAGIKPGATATASGIKAGGDLIVSVAGKAVNKPDDIATAIASNQPGQQIQISFYRGRDKKTVTVTLGDRPATAPSASTPGGGGLPPLP